ncbi:aspartyl/asparaginyl beta-hydroxylase domain-containing protein [Zoogloea sp.]|uniref:aspartyl/asparaginyl beta-hydroxylase domain-containing protein n=1 Tax=Zoogloea sp. TaxID=49181 RepID=UPI0035B4988B
MLASELGKVKARKLRISVPTDEILSSIVRFQPNAFHQRRSTGSNGILDVYAWTSLSLTSSTGRSEDDHASYSSHISECNKLTELAGCIPWFVQFAERLTPVTRCRIFKLAAGGCIPCHTDDNLAKYGLARIIIPVIADNRCITIVGGEDYVMLPGEAWFLNDDHPHSVMNSSDRDRIVMCVQTFNLAKLCELL